MIDFKRFVKGILLRGEATDPTDNLEGSVFHNSATQRIKAYLQGALRVFVTEDQTQTLQNKTIDATSATGNNTLSADANDIAYDNSLSTLTSTDVKTALDEVDTRLLAQDEAAEITYNDATNPLYTIGNNVQSALDGVKTLIDGQNEADEITYDNTTSGLIATNVQTAIDEVEGRVDTAETGLSDHINDTTGAHAATAISYDNATSGLTAVDAQAAIDEVEGRVDTAESNITTNANNLTDHLNDAVDAHAASAISYNNATSGLTATEAQAALDEIDADLDAHLIDTSVHGVTGNVVGTTDAQVLTNKDIDGGTASNTSRLTMPKNTLANLQALTRKEGTVVYATDEDKLYYDDGAQLLPVGSGEGSGSKNYIDTKNSTFEEASNDWIVFDDGAVSVPVNGVTVGAPSITAAVTTTLGEVQEGLQSFKITKPASDCQGNGVSVNLKDIELGFQGKIAYGSFLYDFSAANYADTLGVWLYDRDTPALINILEANNFVPKGKGTFNFSFIVPDNDPDVSQLRLILMETDTNADAYNLIIDNVTASPEALSVDINLENVFGARISSAGAITSQGPLDWIESVVTTGTTGQWTITFKAGFFSEIPSISGSVNNYTSAGTSVTELNFTSLTSTSVIATTTRTSTSTTFNEAYAFNLTIVRQESLNTTSGLVRNSQLETLNNRNENQLLGTSGDYITGTSLSLPRGKWEVKGNVAYGNNGVNPAYTSFALTWASVAGSNTSTIPAGLAANLNGNTAFNLENSVKRISLSDSFNNVEAPSFIIEVINPITIHLVPQALASAPANARISSQVTAQRMAFNQTAIVQQNKIAVLRDQKPSGSDGGTSASSTWSQRVINTLEDPFNLVSLSSNQFTLQAGVYHFKSRAPFFTVTSLGGSVKTRLRNITDSTFDIIGSQDSIRQSGGDNQVSTWSFMSGILNLNSAKTFEIQYFMAESVSTFGLGLAISSGIDEVYTQVEITKIGE